MENYGFIRVSAAVPKVKVAGVEYNKEAIMSMIDKAEADRVSIIVFPELSITGYTCGDLFGQRLLIQKAEAAVKSIREHTRGKSLTVIVGAPVNFRNKLYNCALVIRGGLIRGIVPKCHLSSAGGFHEARWFSSGSDFLERNNFSGTVKDDGKNFYSESLSGKILYAGRYSTISPNLLFNIGEALFAVEIGNDLNSPLPPSSHHSLAGAHFTLNLAADNETLMKHNLRRDRVRTQSSASIGAYIYCSCGYGESTQDMVFPGSSFIYENGEVLAENQRFLQEGSLVEADIDITLIKALRNRVSSYCSINPDGSRDHEFAKYYSIMDLGPAAETDFNKKLLRHIEPHPFIPETDSSAEDKRYEEILSIQASALNSRLDHIGCKKLIIGVSGGLDSTLALLAASIAYDKGGRDRKDIIGITMPGLGTSGRTYDNALKLMELLGISSKEISIVPAVNLHFKAIGQDPQVHDATYENSQARERTKILMDLANKENGIVLGTGDLSELALGWATYNGDHMSMYGINSGIPKTAVRYIIKKLAHKYLEENGGKELGKILLDIVETPVSPELTPLDERGGIVQKTEDLVGPYELHDFFLYNFLVYGHSPSKVLFLCRKAFIAQNEGGKEKYSDEIIEKWLKKFYRRFFSQQFKRSCLPDGPKIFSVSLSPRSDWFMPSDAKSELWLKEAGEL